MSGLNLGTLGFGEKSLLNDEGRYARYLQQVFMCDANESVIAARALIKFANTIYEERMTGFQIFELLNVTSAGTGYEAIGYVMSKMYGDAAIIDTETENLPKSDVSDAEFLEKVRTIGTSFGWTLEDVWKSARTGKSLDTLKAKSARRAIFQKIDNNGFFGSTKSGLKGLLDSAYTALYNAYSVPENGSGSGAARAKWANKTGAQILTDCNAMYNAIVTATNRIFPPNIFAVSDSDYDILFSVYRSDYDNRTVGEIFQNNKRVKIVPITKLNVDVAGHAYNGKDVKIMFNNSDECASYEVPLLFEQRPLQQSNLNYLVPCVSQISSVQIRQPKAFAIAAS